MTSKPLHVRLEVMVDSANADQCDMACPALTMLDHQRVCAFFRRELRESPHTGWPLRYSACVVATTADALNAAVVEAAKAWADDGPTDWNFITDRDLFDAVDALRTAERKEKR